MWGGDVAEGRVGRRVSDRGHDGPGGVRAARMSDEARELHRIIRASARDMLDAYRIQASVGPVTDRGACQ